jgi:hypothetical protein
MRVPHTYRYPPWLTPDNARAHDRISLRACNISLDIVVYTSIVADVPNKIMISLRLDAEQARLLKVVKARDGVPESEQIRRALAIWFEQKGVMKPKRRA